MSFSRDRSNDRCRSSDDPQAAHERLGVRIVSIAAYGSEVADRRPCPYRLTSTTHSRTMHPRIVHAARPPTGAGRSISRSVASIDNRTDHSPRLAGSSRIQNSRSPAIHRSQSVCPTHPSTYEYISVSVSSGRHGRSNGRHNDRSPVDGRGTIELRRQRVRKFQGDDD